MINKDKLLINLETLQRNIPSKPAVKTNDYPKTIKEGLTKYYNQRSLHSLELNTNNLIKLNWPLPLWVDPGNINIGFWNKFHYKKWFNSWVKNGKLKFKGFKGFDWLWCPVLANTYSRRKIDDYLVEVFEINIKYFSDKLLSNALLTNKRSIIIEAIDVYKTKRYSASISTIFPLIDYLVRKLLNTTNLAVSVQQICKLFKECGFDINNLDHLMPFAAMQNFTYAETKEEYFEKFRSPEFKELIEKLDSNYKFGIIGPALSSFLHFSNLYYNYYKEDINENDILNRHAILHGSVNAFNTKINTVKLFTYLFLILELEPVFNILFAEL